MRLNLILMLALAIVCVAPIVAAAARNPAPTVMTADQFARIW